MPDDGERDGLTNGWTTAGKMRRKRQRGTEMAPTVRTVAETASFELSSHLEPDETGGFVVICPLIPGCFSQGETVGEALANICEAIQLCLEEMASAVRKFPLSKALR